MANALKTLFGDIASAIKEKTGDTATMKPAEFPAKIAAIPTGGGGSAAGAVTVTFCNYDGTELYSRQVFIGDDCPDPVTQGKIPTPTKESTAQYDYTHNGWSTAANGEADQNALKNITEDRTVYAAYSRVIRYYNVKFYDGSTLLKAVRVAYGSQAVPPDTGKEGYSFVGWTPSDLAIYGDTDFYGEWESDEGWLVYKEFPSETITSTINNCRLVYSPDGSRLFVANENLLYMFDSSVQPYNLLKTYSIYSSTDRKASNITISNDGSLLAVSLNYSTSDVFENIRVYSVGESGLTKLTLPHTSTGSSSNVKGLAFHPDGNALFVSFANTLKHILIDTSDTSKTLPATYITMSDSTYKRGGSAVYTNNGEKLIVSALDTYYDAPTVFDVLNGYQIEDSSTTFGTAKFYSTFSAISPDDKYIAFAGGEGATTNYASFTVYDITTTPYAKTKSVSFGSVVVGGSSRHIAGTCIAYSHDGSLLAIGLAYSPFIKIYDTATWREKDLPLQLPTAKPISLSFNHDDTRLAMAVGASDKVNLYEVRK